MKILYFARLREQIGKSEEQVSLPENIRCLGDLIDWLEGRGPEYAAALSNRTILRAAVNEEHAPMDTPVSDADEIALFPPVTGG